jgi:hypothetical protein
MSFERADPIERLTAQTDLAEAGQGQMICLLRRQRWRTNAPWSPALKV